MIKFVNTEVTLAEVPSEITLCISISGCKNHCKGCHSSYLWDDIGDELTTTRIDELIECFSDISCICIMGGDHDEDSVRHICEYIKSKGLKTAWYSGIARPLDTEWAEYLDYIKIGPYIEHLGPLNNPTTNQRFYKITNNGKDITFNNIKFY